MLLSSDISSFLISYNPPKVIKDGFEIYCKQRMTMLVNNNFKLRVREESYAGIEPCVDGDEGVAVESSHNECFILALNLKADPIIFLEVECSETGIIMQPYVYLQMK